MGIVDLVLAVILGLAGFAIVAVLLGLIFRHCFSFLQSGREELKFKRALQRISNADELMEEDRFLDALSELRTAIILDVVRNRRLISSFNEHHQNILSRLLVIAEHTGGRAANIAEVEKLFLERSELQNLYVKAADAFTRLQEKRQVAGKPVPSWSKGDFSRRMTEIQKELQINYKALQAEIEKLFSAVQTPSREGITYH